MRVCVCVLWTERLGSGESNGMGMYSNVINKIGRMFRTTLTHTHKTVNGVIK